MKVKEKAKQFVNNHKNLLIGVGVGLGSCGLMLTGYYFGRNRGLVEGGFKVAKETTNALCKTLDQCTFDMDMEKKEVDKIATNFTSNFKTTKLNGKYAVWLDSDIENERISDFLVKD